MSKMEIYKNNYQRLASQTDKMFAGLLIFQWFMGVAMALWVSPQTWIGETSQVHIHVYASILIGAVITVFPVYLIWRNPGAVINRYAVAVAQISYSMLFVHVSGGRIETHFHIFVSLAFLAFYRDMRPVLIATLITALDHIVRGTLWPQSVYGVLTATPWRALEHSAWVLFQDFFLYIGIAKGQQEMMALAENQEKLEETLAGVEEAVRVRTAELRSSQETIIAQQQSLIVSSKMSALGEMAGGIAHEINTPLAVIQMRAEQLMDAAQDDQLDKQMVLNSLNGITTTVKKISKIVQGLRSFSRDGRRDPMMPTSVNKIVEETFDLCRQRFSNHGVDIKYVSEHDAIIDCRSSEISQVLLNLLNNAYDAVRPLQAKWITVELKRFPKHVMIEVTDSGAGIPKEIQDRLMQPFFTTKDIGKGTGLGLSISKGLAEGHGGKISIDNDCANTRFSVILPLKKGEDMAVSA